MSAPVCDAISLALAPWHRFRELLRVPRGPYMDSRYFGEGIGIAVKKGNDSSGWR